MRFTRVAGGEDRAVESAPDAPPARRRPGPLRVLMANEPRAYRESIAAVFGQLRPGTDVRCAGPEDLAGEVARFSPDMVVCSRVVGAIEERVRVWVELYADHAARSVAGIGGERAEFPEIQLSDLLWVVDEAERLAQRS